MKMGEVIGMNEGRAGVPVVSMGPPLSGVMRVECCSYIG